MSNILDILQETGDPDPSKLGKILDLTEEEVVAQLETLRSEGTLLGWVPLLHPSKKESNLVRAVIEVKISPEREGGFDRLAHRIYTPLPHLCPSVLLRWRGFFPLLLIFYFAPIKNMDIYCPRTEKIQKNLRLAPNFNESRKLCC
jgi:DNA-binding Lrp family transcriptional regulator